MPDFPLITHHVQRAADKQVLQGTPDGWNLPSRNACQAAPELAMTVLQLLLGATVVDVALQSSLLAQEEEEEDILINWTEGSPSEWFIWFNIWDGGFQQLDEILGKFWC